MGKKIFRRVKKVSDEQIGDIGQLVSQGKTKEEISRVVGLAPGTIYGICRRNGWQLPKKKRARKRAAPAVSRREPSRIDTILELLAARERGIISENTFTTILKCIV